MKSQKSQCLPEQGDSCARRVSFKVFYFEGGAVAPLFAPPLGGLVPGAAGFGCGEVAPGVSAPGEVVSGEGPLLGF